MYQTVHGSCLLRPHWPGQEAVVHSFNPSGTGRGFLTQAGSGIFSRMQAHGNVRSKFYRPWTGTEYFPRSCCWIALQRHGLGRCKSPRKYSVPGHERTKSRCLSLTSIWNENIPLPSWKGEALFNCYNEALLQLTSYFLNKVCSGQRGFWPRCLKLDLVIATTHVYWTNNSKLKGSNNNFSSVLQGIKCPRSYN